MRIVLLIVILMVVGCANIPQPGARFPSSQMAVNDQAVVHFYRPKTFLMSIVEVNIFIDQNLELVLSNGTYSTTYLRPGKYNFKAKGKPNRYGEYSAALRDSICEFEHELEAGKTYYIVWYPSVETLSSKYDDNFVVSDFKNPYYFGEGILTDIKAGFGVVKPEFALIEISKTRQSNSVVDLERI